MALKQCKYCGKPFVPSRQAQAVCEDCLAAARSTTIRPRTCRACGTTFDGGPRAWYCPSCRAERQKEASRRARKEGTKRPLGSIDHCVICGKEYVVNSARQRYCPDCAPEASAAADREASKAWNAANDYYAKRAQSPRSGIRLCVICGNPLPPGSNAVTCSPECRRENLTLSRRRAEANRRRRKSLISTPPPNASEAPPPQEAKVPAAKTCCICGAEFIPNRGNQKYCKDCAAKQASESRKRYCKRYYEQNREKILAARAKNPSQSPEARKAYQAEYYAKNKERIKAQRKTKREQDKK